MLGNSLRRLLENAAIGLLIGLAAAGLATGFSSSGSSHGLAVALVFVAAELASLLVGPTVGVAGLVGGSLSLCFFLFDPIGTVYVSCPADRISLFWLLAAGTPLCLALAWTSSHTSRRGTRAEN